MKISEDNKERASSRPLFRLAMALGVSAAAVAGVIMSPALRDSGEQSCTQAQGATEFPASQASAQRDILLAEVRNFESDLNQVYPRVPSIESYSGRAEIAVQWSSSSPSDYRLAKSILDIVDDSKKDALLHEQDPQNDGPHFVTEGIPSSFANKGSVVCVMGNRAALTPLAYNFDTTFKEGISGEMPPTIMTPVTLPSPAIVA